MSTPAPVVWHGEFFQSDQVCFRIGAQGDERIAEWPGLCRLVARRDGSDARLSFEPDVDPRTVEKIRRGGAALLLRHLEGKLGLHGAAVAMNGRALVLLGRSGEGKSTLAAALCSAGAALLADDAVAIDPAPSGGWMIAPQEIDHWLDRAAREGLGLPPPASGASKATGGRVGPLARGKEPMRISRAAGDAARLVAFVDLAFGGEHGPTLTRLHGIDAVGTLVPQVARFVLDDAAVQRQELDLLHRLVSAVPCLRLERPRDFAHLSTTLDRVVALLGEDPPLGLS